jgi:hypothetical protein
MNECDQLHAVTRSLASLPLSAAFRRILKRFHRELFQARRSLSKYKQISKHADNYPISEPAKNGRIWSGAVMLICVGDSVRPGVQTIDGVDYWQG